MPWLRLDDGFAQHPKIVQLTPKDRWTWLELLCYCARYRTEGRIPAATSEVVRGATPSFLTRALELRLLDLVPSTTSEYQVHDWNDYNPARIDDVDEAVAQFFADKPQASANDAVRTIGGGRNQVLAAVKRYRTGTNGGTSTGTEPVSRARSRPVPSPEVPARAVPAPSYAADDGLDLADEPGPDQEEPTAQDYAHIQTLDLLKEMP